MPLPHVCGENDLAGGDDVAGEPAQPGDALRADAVGLEHVEAARVEELPELVRLTGQLAAGDPDVDPARSSACPS